ncbi:hypothetical protein [Lysobacter fragariae]
MQRALIGLSVWFLAGVAHAQMPPDCSALPRQGLPVQPTLLAPASPELTAPTHQLGAPTGVLAQAFDEALAVDNVLLRIRSESCMQLAKATVPSAPAAMPSSTDPAAYQPKTQYDNTPWRFNMSQNGKRMTADEFSAWMKAKGVRVAKGAPPAGEAVPAEKAEEKK